MFGAAVRGVRSSDGVVRSIRDCHDADIWTTLLLRPENVSGSKLYELHGFCYGMGGTIAGSRIGSGNVDAYSIGRGVSASRSDTNMRVANQFVDEELQVGGVEWRIPPITPSRLTGRDDYRVTLQDVEEIASKAVLRLYLGGEKPFIERRLAAHIVTYKADDDPVRMSCYLVKHPDATDCDVKVWGQKIPLTYVVPIGRIEKFWCELTFADPPHIGGSVAVIVTLVGRSVRDVQ